MINMLLMDVDTSLTHYFIMESEDSHYVPYGSESPSRGQCGDKMRAEADLEDFQNYGNGVPVANRAGRCDIL